MNRGMGRSCAPGVSGRRHRSGLLFLLDADDPRFTEPAALHVVRPLMAVGAIGSVAHANVVTGCGGAPKRRTKLCFC
uniref:Uncharacterized protein n=1 Tax=Magnetospirillum gryphiswaldense TaxID=55518 RepID=A4TZ07_9PROT|nr:hypothetical protein MGR_1521 [Magnetospirillum gryphiswaldense MSR-1]